ncbi:MAG: PQQ-dependent sugar dehydrogenase [Verrucomicrobiota bacterium]
MKNRAFIFILSLTGFSACAEQIETEIKAVSPETKNYTHEVVVSDIAIPWGMAFLPDGSILVADRVGDLVRSKDGANTKIEGLPKILVRGQGGLMDIELHPQYETNGWLYLAYSSPKGKSQEGNTAIMRAKLDGDKLVSKKVLYKGSPDTKVGRHFGSRIEFDDQGYLYFAIGDRGDRDSNPQDIKRDGGKIYRIHEDGRIPKDNPFVDTKRAKAAIYSYGHRNPQGMAKHPETGAIWVHEHGPRGGDEINIVQKGGNYGWPVASYGINYNGTSFTDKTSAPGMEPPYFFWVPSIAPSGMAFVTSDVYPEWKGSLMVGALKSAYLERLIIENDQVVAREKILENLGRVRSVRQGPDGYLYVGVEGTGIVKIVPNS